MYKRQVSLNLLFSDDDVSVLRCNYYVLQYYDDISRSGLVVAGRLAVDRHVGHLTLTPTSVTYCVVSYWVNFALTYLITFDL